MAGLGVVSMVSDMSRSPQGLLKKRNRPNARQRRHRRAARSPVEEMAFCAPRQVTICVASLQERLGLTTKDADFSGVAHPRSVRNDFPGPVGLDGYG